MDLSDIPDLNWYCFSDLVWNAGPLWVIDSERRHYSDGFNEMALFYSPLTEKGVFGL